MSSRNRTVRDAGKSKPVLPCHLPSRRRRIRCKIDELRFGSAEAVEAGYRPCDGQDDLSIESYKHRSSQTLLCSLARCGLFRRQSEGRGNTGRLGTGRSATITHGCQDGTCARYESSYLLYLRPTAVMMVTLETGEKGNTTRDSERSPEAMGWRMWGSVRWVGLAEQ